MVENSSEGRTVKTADTIFGIIETLRESDGATVTEVAEERDIALSTAHTHLSTLEQKGYVVDRDGEYHLSLRFLDHGIYVRSQWDIVEHAQPSLDTIASETGEGTWLIGEENGKAVFLANSMGEHGVAIGGRVGSRVPLHWIAAGKAILSQYTEEEIRNIVAQHGLPQKASETITDVDELLSELEDIGDEGVVFAESEYFDGLRAVGVPIVPEDEVVGAISVAGPSNRLSGEYFREELPEFLLGTVNELEIRYVTD